MGVGRAGGVLAYTSSGLEIPREAKQPPGFCQRPPNTTRTPAQKTASQIWRAPSSFRLWPPFFRGKKGHGWIRHSYAEMGHCREGSMWSLESCGPRGSGPPAAGSRRHWWEAGPLGARTEPHILETSQQSEINAKDFIPILTADLRISAFK